MKNKIHALAGLSLVELLVASALASVIGLAAIASASTAVALLRSNERIVETNDISKSLIEYLVARTQGAGGGAVRPWFALKITDDADAINNTDSLLVFEVDPDIPQCPVTAATTNELSSGANGAGVCCITPDFVGRPITVITSIDELAGVYVNHTQTISGVSASDCKLTFAGTPQLAAPEYYDPPSTGPATRDFPSPVTGGWIVAGSLKRYKIDPAQNALVIEEDNDFTDTDYSLTPRVLDAPVYDLQFALGYDADFNGVVTENGTSADEFFLNNAGDVLGSGGLTDAEDDEVRLLGIGVTVGATTKTGGGNSAQIFNGNVKSIPDVFLRGSTGRAYLRNLDVFF